MVSWRYAHSSHCGMEFVNEPCNASVILRKRQHSALCKYGCNAALDIRVLLCCVPMIARLRMWPMAPCSCSSFCKEKRKRPHVLTPLSRAVSLFNRLRAHSLPARPPAERLHYSTHNDGANSASGAMQRPHPKTWARPVCAFRVPSSACGGLPGTDVADSVFNAIQH